MKPLSVLITTYNEEANIKRCISSVKNVADEIVVLDSFSSDTTVEIATGMGAKVYQRKFAGYVEQNNLALHLATHNYVLCLDADEALSEELCRSIQRIKGNHAALAYSMNRCLCYCGRYLRHGNWYPDRKVRLVDRRYCRWGGTIPHNKLELMDYSPILHLRGDLLHYSFDSIDDNLYKSINFSTLSATSLNKIGKRARWFHILINPFWTFCHGYIIRLGFMDGFYGLVTAINSAHGCFLKYVKLYRLERNAQKTTRI